MRALSIVGLFLLSACVYAEGKCEIDLHGDLQITNEAIELIERGRSYKIVADEVLWVNNQQIKLGKNQEVLIGQYAKDIRSLVPEVRLLAVDSIELATTAINIMLRELLGPNHQAQKKIDSEFHLLRKNVDDYFLSEQPIRFSHDTINPASSHRDIFGEQIEARITALVTSVGEEVAWALLKNVGTAMVSDVSFEERMERFAEKMGSGMEARGQQVAVRANKVCVALKNLDRQEEQLKKHITELASFDVIRLSKVGSHTDNK
ncbi:MAG: DUF2884 family protein [Moraxellaceae bacterium]|nr:MAG: DUF2884 family protein [Moraxellaceae bacterium]